MSCVTGTSPWQEGLIVGMGEYHGKVEVDVSGKLVLPASSTLTSIWRVLW